MAKIAWCITGAAHFLKESVDIISEIKEVDILASPAGLEVMKMYRVTPPELPLTDKTASTATCRGFFSGVYDLLVVAPATSNSVAKFVYGISDSMVTTLFAQAGKAGVPIAVFPTDSEEIIETMGLTKPLTIKARPVDLENVEKLRKFPGVTVLESPKELERFLIEYRESKR